MASSILWPIMLSGTVLCRDQSILNVNDPLCVCCDILVVSDKDDCDSDVCVKLLEQFEDFGGCL